MVPYNITHITVITNTQPLCIYTLDITVSLCGLGETNSTGVNIVHVMDRAAVWLLCHWFFVFQNLWDGLHWSWLSHFNMSALRLHTNKKEMDPRELPAVEKWNSCMKYTSVPHKWVYLCIWRARLSPRKKGSSVGADCRWVTLFQVREVFSGCCFGTGFQATVCSCRTRNWWTSTLWSW